MFFKYLGVISICFIVNEATEASNGDCGFVFENDCPDSIQGGVYFDEVYGDDGEVIIVNQTVIIRQNSTVNRIRVEKCGFLTVKGMAIKYES